MNTIIAVDFDGTIVEHAYPKIGKEIPFAIDTLIKLQKEGYRLVLWSVRTGKLLQEAVDYCAERGLEFYAVNCDYPEEEFDPSTSSRKVNAEIYIDDRNLGGLPDWGVIYAMIHGRCQPTYDTQYAQQKPASGWSKFKKTILGV